MEYIGFIHRGLRGHLFYFFFFLLQVLLQQQQLLITGAFVQGTGLGEAQILLTECIDCRHITGSQMCVAFLPPAAPKSPSQVVFIGKKKKYKL